MLFFAKRAEKRDGGGAPVTIAIHYFAISRMIPIKTAKRVIHGCRERVYASRVKWDYRRVCKREYAPSVVIGEKNNGETVPKANNQSDDNIDDIIVSSV